MIFAAGLGTRLRPLTDTMPKALVPVGGRPLIDLLLDKLHRSGFERIVVNVHHFADMLEQHIRDVAPLYEGMTIVVSDERDNLLDTGGGLRHAAGLFYPQYPVLIHNVDILSNADLQTLYDDNAAMLRSGERDAVLVVSKRHSSRTLIFEMDNRLVGWRNMQTGEVRGPATSIEHTVYMMPFSGIHIVHPRLFWQMSSFPVKFSIIDFYLQACTSGKIYGQIVSDLHLLDVGKQDTLEAAATFASTHNC